MTFEVEINGRVHAVSIEKAGAEAGRFRIAVDSRETIVDALRPPTPRSSPLCCCATAIIMFGLAGLTATHISLCWPGMSRMFGPTEMSGAAAGPDN